MEIDSLPPSEIARYIRDGHPKWQELIVNGYDLTEEDKSDPVECAAEEFDHPDEHATVFVAKEGNEILGSLIFVRWDETETNEPGKRFWSRLREQRTAPAGEIACLIGGIVVNPNFRNRGVGKFLYQQALEIVKPAVIVGHTKTVDAVLLRSKLNGYRTGYGPTEVTSDSDLQGDFRPFIHAFLYADNEEVLLPEGIVYLHSEGISPTIPNTEGYPLSIQHAFEPVIHAQQRLGQANTVMAPLISVKTSFI